MSTKKHEDEHDTQVAERERDFDEMKRMRNEDPLFIEKTRPEDPSGREGQLTRDNVTPKIPSGKPGDPPGPIVDPKSLGMEGIAGAPVPKAEAQTPVSINEPPDDPNVEPAAAAPPVDTPVSINEPPGSNVGEGSEGPGQQPAELAAPAAPDEAVDDPDLTDPDEMEDEIDEAIEDGDARSTGKKKKKGK